METKLREVKLPAQSYKANCSNRVLQRQGCIRDPEDKLIMRSVQVVLRSAGSEKGGRGGADAPRRGRLSSLCGMAHT